MDRPWQTTHRPSSQKNLRWPGPASNLRLAFRHHIRPCLPTRRHGRATSEADALFDARRS